MHMENIEKMSNAEFVAYLTEVLTEEKKDLEPKLIQALERAKSIIVQTPQVNINIERLQVVREGKRVSICSDGSYYFLISNSTKKCFAPSLIEDDILSDFIEIEEGIG